MYPYIDPQAFANEQAMLQQRINQLEQARNQQMSMYAPQSQQQPHTAWMMDNNSPVFYVKSVDGMGSATFKVFQFAEISPEALNPAQSQTKEERQEYVTRQEFDALLTRLGEKPENKEEPV